MNKTIVFDMDGTIANLYKVPKWETHLRNLNPLPYQTAKKMFKKRELYPILNKLKAGGTKIVITSWLTKFSTKEYDEEVRKAKKEWLDKHNFPYDELHFIKYGTTKANVTRHKGGYQLLIDDNDKVRKGWHLGKAIHPNEMIQELQSWI